jgi:hypothetical protein
VAWNRQRRSSTVTPSHSNIYKCNAFVHPYICINEQAGGSGGGEAPCLRLACHPDLDRSIHTQQKKKGRLLASSVTFFEKRPTAAAAAPPTPCSRQRPTPQQQHKFAEAGCVCDYAQLSVDQSIERRTFRLASAAAAAAALCLLLVLGAEPSERSIPAGRKTQDNPPPHLNRRHPN